MKSVKDRIDDAVKQTLDPVARRAEIARLEKRLPILYCVMNVFIFLVPALFFAMVVTGSTFPVGPLLVPMALMLFCYYMGAQRLLQLRVEDARGICEQAADGHLKTGISTSAHERRFRAIVIGVILALSTSAFWFPQYLRVRGGSASKACVNNLRVIEAAKEQSAMQMRWEKGTDCDNPACMTIINGYIKGNTVPICPDGGIYHYNPIGVEPTCSKNHRLPNRVRTSPRTVP